MVSQRRKIRIGVLLFSLLWVSYCYGGLLLPTGGVELKAVKIAKLGSLALDLEVAGQTIYVDVHYPQDRVLLVGDGGEGDAGIPYEMCYWPDVFLINLTNSQYPLYRWSSQPGFPLSPMTQTILDDGIGREIRYGKRGDVVYRMDGPLGGRPLVDVAIRALFAGSDTLASCYVSRLRVEQWMQGGWTRLTQFNIGVFHFKKAPEDTFRLRAEFVPMRVTFLRDRVEVRAGTVAEREKAAYVVRRPRGGYWPNGRGIDPYFETFEADTIPAGERFAMEIANMRNDPFSFDVPVLIGGKLQPNLVQMDFAQSNLVSALARGIGANISTWPLLATPAAVWAADKEPGGYPGGAIEPRWAVEKMLALDLKYWRATSETYWTASAPNDSIYARELTAAYDELARWREEEKMRNKNHGVRK